MQLTDRKQYGGPDGQIFVEMTKKLNQYPIMKKERNFLKKNFNRSPWTRSEQSYNPADCFSTKNRYFFVQCSKRMKNKEKLGQKNVCPQIDPLDSLKAALST